MRFLRVLIALPRILLFSCAACVATFSGLCYLTYTRRKEEELNADPKVKETRTYNDDDQDDKGRHWIFDMPDWEAFGVPLRALHEPDNAWRPEQESAEEWEIRKRHEHGLLASN